MKCRWVKVNRRYIERCQNEQLIDGLCPFHFALACRINERHEKQLRLTWDIEKTKEKATLLEFREGEDEMVYKN